MARLPQPGGDSGNWGNVLNEYLLQSHQTDGTIKANAVDSAAIQNNSISGAKLQDNTVTDTKLYVSGGSNGEVLAKNSGQPGGLQWIAAPGVPDADATTKGVVQLTGDLGGTASSPTVPGLTGKTNTSRAINTTHSLTGGGDLTADRTLSLVNDAAAPGNTKYYGTDGSGTRGFFDIPSAPSYPNSSGTATVVPRPAVTDVRDYGALGDGVADDTTAINAAVAAAHSAGTSIYFPAGEYLVTAFPALDDHDIVHGDGMDHTTIIFSGSGTLVTLSSKMRVHFKNMGFWITGVSGQGFRLSNCFSCSFDSVMVRGSHTSATYPTYLSTVGIRLDSNTGGTMIINCLISNFGTGLATYCIQNYVTNCKFTTNYTGVLGSGNNDNAGLSITNSEFVSDTDVDTTQRHIYIDGAANTWWLANVWFEGAASAVVVGVAGTGGPSSFGMSNCHISARDYCIDLQHCRQPYLADIIFADELGGPPAELRIDATNAGEGTAINLITLLGSDIDPSVFTEYWTVIGRGRSLMTRLDRTLNIRNTGTSNDMLTALDEFYSDKAAIISSGAFLSNDTAAGVILKSPDGHYWRMSVNNSGVISTADLGTGRPSA